MTKQERLNSLLQVKKSTGEILTARKPSYRGKTLSSVYGRYSYAKEDAYERCKDLLYYLADDYSEVYSYGITSANGFKFTFAGVFKSAGVKYVLICTASYDRVYLLEE